MEYAAVERHDEPVELTLFDTTARCAKCREPLGKVVWEAVRSESDGALDIIHVCPGCAHHFQRVRQLP